VNMAQYLLKVLSQEELKHVLNCDVCEKEQTEDGIIITLVDDSRLLYTDKGEFRYFGG
jgi:hypothetical protein